MSMADEMKKAFGFRKYKARDIDDDETDAHELAEAGIVIPNTDARRKSPGGVRQSNLSPQQRAALRKLRGGK